MAPESSRAVVILKFDMHIYTSELTSTELKDAINEYCIPIDLHPRLPHPGMMMNRLPSRYIGWKKKFFLLDRRAIPYAMPWRHSDTDLHDDFPTHFNEDDVARLSEFQVLLRPPSRHLLYMCGLTTACRHSGLQYHIQDQDKNAVINMDTFLKLPTWTGTVVSKGDPLPEDQCPKPRVTPSLPVEDTLSATPLNQAIPEIISNPATVASEVLPQVEKEVVDLSGNKRVSSPPVIDVPPLPRQEHHDTHEIHSQSSHHGSEDEPVRNRYVPNRRLRNDLHVCTFRACKELVSHLATSAEDEFLGALSNVELNHDYVDLQNRNDAHLLELDHLRSSVRRTEQENEGLNNKLSLIKSAHSGSCSSVELARSEIDRQKLVREFIPVVVRRLHTSVEYRKALAVPETKHKELFAKQYPYVQKVADSYLLPMADLLRVSPDVLAPRPTAEVPGSIGEQTDDPDPRLSSPHHEITEDTPFGTTT
nr:hypothetical protein [Tanacetum cinerariifolium]